MRKMFFAFVGLMVTCGSVAAGVSERVNCVETKARIDTLVAGENLNDSERALLTDLRASYRSNCTARAAGRGSRTIAAKRVPSGDADAKTIAPIAETDDVQTSEEVFLAANCTNPDEHGCCPGEVFEIFEDNIQYCCIDDICFPPMAVTVVSAPAAPQKSDEEIAAEITANLEKGLCGDGAKPNKFGCCTGEIFKDLGNSVFACCKTDSEECFLPIK